MNVDPQIDLLTRPIGEMADEIAKLLAQIPFVSGAEKTKMLARIQFLLGLAETEVREWAEKQLKDAADEHHDDLVGMLPLIGASKYVDDLVDNAGKRLRSAVRNVSRSTLILGQRLKSGNLARSTVSELLRTRIIPPFEQSDLAAQEQFQKHVEAELKRGFVTILGQNGRAYRYAMDYFVGLQAFMSRQLLLREISVYRTSEAGYDLVQMSPNASSIGDFCDLYAGNVFSISGTHEVYPPLSSVPNGGPPMHVWCRHYLLPYTSDVIDPSLAEVPEEFLELGKDGAASANDFHRLFLEYKDDVDDEG